jgi:hypothetical protein
LNRERTSEEEQKSPTRRLSVARVPGGKTFLDELGEEFRPIGGRKSIHGDCSMDAMDSELFGFRKYGYFVVGLFNRQRVHSDLGDVLSGRR